MKKIQMLVCFAFMILSCGFISTADSNKNEYRKNIPLGSANEIKTEISFTVGELNISPCSNHLMEGVYRFNKERWKPDISYREESHKGYLEITALDDNEDMNYDDTDSCQWNIALNRNIKNNLNIEMLAGKGNIDLHGCTLKRFDLKMAAGELHVNLRNTSVPNFKFKAFAGEAVIDLSGKWENDLNADIKGGVGEITLKLPSKKGIKMNITGILGDIDASDFTKQGNTYTNALYGRTNETLYIELTGGIGNVTIQMND